jgi:hypothetical protein
MAFYYFATGQDLVEIFADIEAEAPIRIVHEHNKTGTHKECFQSARQIPGLTDDDPSARFRSGFLMFPFQCEPVMTEVEAPTRTLMCVYRTDNPDALDVSQPSMLFVESFPRPELTAGEIRFFAMTDYPGERNPSAEAKTLANRVRKAIRKRSSLLHSEGTKRVYIARRALEKARNKEIDLTCCHLRWSAAESEADAIFLRDLELPKAALRPEPKNRDRFDNVTPIRNYRVRTVEFSEPADPDLLFVAAYDDLKDLIEAASDADDMNYSRLGPPRFRSICQSADGLPGLGASSLKRDIESGVISWRGDPADYRRVHEPFGLAEYRIGLLPDGYIAPSMIIFPGGAHLRGSKRQAKRLFCGYARLVHGSGREHFEAFREAVFNRIADVIQFEDLPVDIPVLPEAKALLDSGIELDASLLSPHILHHRIASKPDNVVVFPDRPGTGSR